jgi:hypothetical protein
MGSFPATPCRKREFPARISALCAKSEPQTIGLLSVPVRHLVLKTDGTQPTWHIAKLE